MPIPLRHPLSGRVRATALARVTAAMVSAGGVPVRAADAEGRYAIKGVGLMNCGQLVQAFEKNRDPVLEVVASWLGGYITAQNRAKDGVVDVAPWQSILLLAELLANHCRAYPDQAVFVATDLMLRAMAPTAMAEQSESERIDAGDGRTIEIFRSVLQRAQRQLIEQGYLSGAADGRFGPKTAEAFGTFQAAKNLEITRLPDQQTLLALFSPLWNVQRQSN